MNVHDNLLRNCGSGIITEKGEARIGEVIDDRTFTRSTGPVGLPIERLDPEMVKGWTIVWKPDPNSPKYDGMSVIESFDPQTLHFKLREPHAMKTGDRFEVIAPSVNWTMHDKQLQIVSDLLFLILTGAGLHCSKPTW